MTISADETVAKYAALRETYDQFRSRVESLLADLVDKAKIDYVQIESRTKTLESVRDKLARKKMTHLDDALQRMHDLVGVRIITYYAEDIDEVAALISDAFDVDPENSANKQDALLSDQFGYLSAHFVGQLNDKRGRLPEWEAYAALTVEIQVRTALQHAWAAVSHKLAYKNAEEAPDQLGRRLYRLSALFELADEQFSSIRDEASKIDSEYRENVGKGDFEIPLDVASLQAYLESSRKVKNLRALKLRHEFDDNEIEKSRRELDFSDFLTALKTYGMDTLADVDEWLGSRSAIERASRALRRAFPKETPVSASVEDWLTQILIILKDHSSKPGSWSYDDGTVATLAQVRDSLQT